MTKEERIMGRLEKRSKQERKKRLARRTFNQHTLMEQVDEESMQELVSKYKEKAHRKVHLRVHHA
jgi:hypothetical protein